MNAITRFGLAVFLAAGLAASASAADMLSEYQKLYTKAAFRSNKESVLKGLVETGKPAASSALEYCVGVSRAAVEDASKDVEKARPKVVAAQEKLDVVIRAMLEDLRKHGDSDPEFTMAHRTVVLPEDTALLQAQADMAKADGALNEQQQILVEALDAHGELLARIPADAQTKIRDEWKKSRLSSKDWGARADCYEVLGHTPTDWALDLLIAAADPASPEAEPDARALVVVVDGLSGERRAGIQAMRRLETEDHDAWSHVGTFGEREKDRELFKRILGEELAKAGDVNKTTPALAARLDDVRWLVRVAVVQALETTPSKAGIDALVKRAPKEDGRLKLDIQRALKALTGADTPTNPEMWRIWWEQNREKWTGKPVKAEDSKIPNPAAGLAAEKPKEDPDAKKTGFFGIAVESKRVVFVIDVSGSMNDSLGGTGPDSKTKKCKAAKDELKRVIGALDENSLFDVVFFSSSVHVWKPELQKADPKSKKEAEDLVDATPVVGATDTYDALEAAFNIGDVGKGKKRDSDPTGEARVDTIMFLSDGEPTQGLGTLDPKYDSGNHFQAIIDAVKNLNRARRVVINVVAFGVNLKGGADPKFMKGLADATGGQYVEK